MSTAIPSVKPAAHAHRVERRDALPCETFRRLLQDKDDGVLACAAAMPVLPRPAMAPDAGCAPRTSLAVSATHAVLGTALHADTSPLPLPGRPADAGQWQVSIHEPLGVAVEVRATREPTAWTLTIASPTTDASMLARHAPRLNERLRTRALPATHVRVERREGNEP